MPSFLVRLTTLHWALGLSAVVHAAALTVRFVDPEGFQRVFEDTPLEVILVNAKSNEAPDKAQAIAQADARDVVLLAGKGHEDYQDAQGHKRPFSDCHEAARAVQARQERTQP